MSSTVLCIVGPTACGKSKLAVLLARRFHGEIVSVDSMQIYRGMTVGTAAPTLREQGGIPHHMVSVADPAQQYSVARFTREADACIQEILQRGHLPILAGGTGLYLDALIRGNDFAYGASDGEVRRALYQQLSEEGIDPLWQELQQVDPAAALRLSPHDEKRILRALEVYRATGSTITQHNLDTARQPRRYDPIYIGLAYADREEMKRQIDLRVDTMMEQGLADEVDALLLRGLSPQATAWQAIGYKELYAAACGQCSREEAVAQIKLRSRQYAKRQLTWLRRNPDIHWIFWEKERDFAKALQISTEILTAQGLS